MSEVTSVVLRQNNTTVGIEYYKIECQKHVSRTLPTYSQDKFYFINLVTNETRKARGWSSNAKEMVIFYIISNNVMFCIYILSQRIWINVQIAHQQTLRGYWLRNLQIPFFQKNVFTVLITAVIDAVNPRTQLTFLLVCETFTDTTSHVLRPLIVTQSFLTY